MDETMMDLAIEVGALDVSAQPLDERIDASGRDQSTRTYAFITAATDLNAVAGALKSAGHDLVCRGRKRVTDLLPAICSTAPLLHRPCLLISLAAATCQRLRSSR